MIARLAVYVAQVRPFYSTAHNTMIALWLLPLYACAALGLWALRNQPLAWWCAGVVATQAVVVALTHADYDGRYLAHVMPLVYPARGLRPRGPPAAWRTRSSREAGGPVTPEAARTFRDVARSLQLWHIWIRLGLQDVRLKFRRSAVGVGWIFVNLAVMVSSIGFIYANLLGQDPREFIPYLTIGMILWGYLTNSIVEGGNAFVHSEGYIKQISLPIYVYVFRFFVSISVTTLHRDGAPTSIVAIFYRVPLGAGTLLAIPGSADGDDRVAAARSRFSRTSTRASATWRTWRRSACRCCST